VSGDVVATKHLYEVQRVREGQLRNGALSDPSSLRGLVATQDVYPNEQLTTAAFARTTAAVAARLAGNERAISIPLDSAHGLIGQVQAGDRVDVFAGFNVKPVDALGRPLTAGGQERP